ncbi:MAG: hypothetical protein K5880_14620 [Hydrogenophaga sp.]|nr:hypothetical protein [Hydrogenophaga sp.]
MELTSIHDGLGNRVPTLRIEGVNLQIVNGTGSTSTVNSTGNLIIGYNEESGQAGQIHERTGSHNLIMGQVIDYFNGTYGSIGTGHWNTLAAPNSSIIASEFSQCDGPFSTINGADNGIVLTPGIFCNVLGGESNAAVAHHSTITGGLGNWINVNGPHGTVSGGWIRTVFTPRDWAAGSLYEFEPDF